MSADWSPELILSHATSCVSLMQSNVYTMYLNQTKIFQLGEEITVQKDGKMKRISVGNVRLKETDYPVYDSDSEI